MHLPTDESNQHRPSPATKAWSTVSRCGQSIGAAGALRGETPPNPKCRIQVGLTQALPQRVIAFPQEPQPRHICTCRGAHACPRTALSCCFRCMLFLEPPMSFVSDLENPDTHHIVNACRVAIRLALDGRGRLEARKRARKMAPGPPRMCPNERSHDRCLCLVD